MFISLYYSTDPTFTCSHNSARRASKSSFSEMKGNSGLCFTYVPVVYFMTTWICLRKTEQECGVKKYWCEKRINFSKIR